MGNRLKNAIVMLITLSCVFLSTPLLTGNVKALSNSHPWADDYGFDTGSQTAQKSYSTCHNKYITSLASIQLEHQTVQAQIMEYMLKAGRIRITPMPAVRYLMAI